MALMTRRFAALVLAVALATACERHNAPDPRPLARRALAGVPVYPLSTEVSVTAGEDAAQLTMSSVDSLGKVAAWFRRSLPLNGWSLQSDLTNDDGSVSISATRGKRPLWLTLRRNVGAPGTTYALIGAIVAGDSGAAADSSLTPRPKP